MKSIETSIHRRGYKHKESIVLYITRKVPFNVSDHFYIAQRIFSDLVDLWRDICEYLYQCCLLCVVSLKTVGYNVSFTIYFDPSYIYSIVLCGFCAFERFRLSPGFSGFLLAITFDGDAFCSLFGRIGY